MMDFTSASHASTLPASVTVVHLEFRARVTALSRSPCVPSETNRDSDNTLHFRHERTRADIQQPSSHRAHVRAPIHYPNWLIEISRH